MVNKITKSGFSLAAALLLGLALLTSAGARAFASADVTGLFQEAARSASQLRRDTNQMAAFSKSRLSWESHAQQINQIKEHINNTGKIVADLHDARDSAAAWQQEAIDRVTPLLEEIASNTESVINHLNDRQHTWHPEYQEYLKSNAELAADLSTLIGDYIDYDSAKARTQELQQKLGFS